MSSPAGQDSPSDKTVQASAATDQFSSIHTIGTGDIICCDPLDFDNNGATSPLSVSISSNLSGASPATINFADDLMRNLAFAENVC